MYSPHLTYPPTQQSQPFTSISWRQTSRHWPDPQTKLGPVSAPTWSYCLTDFIASVPSAPGVVCGSWHNGGQRLLICHSEIVRFRKGLRRRTTRRRKRKTGRLGVPSVPADKPSAALGWKSESGEISVVVVVPVPSPVAIVGAIIMAVAIVVGEIVGAMIIARPPHVAVGFAARIVPVDGCTGRVIQIPMTVVVPVMGLRCRRSVPGIIAMISVVVAASCSHSHVRKRSRSTPPGSRRRQKLTPTLVFASNCSCHRQRVRDKSELPLRICRSRRGQHTGSSASKKAYLRRFPFGMTNLGHL